MGIDSSDEMPMYALKDAAATKVTVFCLPAQLPAAHGKLSNPVVKRATRSVRATAFLF